MLLQHLPLSVGMRIIIDKEIMKIKEIVDANTIIVYRGYQSTAATHIEGASIDVLTTVDDDLLVEPDDDFGFNGLLKNLVILDHIVQHNRKISNEYDD